jgi:rhamnogalacturonan acetylesterase
VCFIIKQSGLSLLTYFPLKFGHNDATSGAVDNGKQDAVGDGYNITSTVTAAK